MYLEIRQVNHLDSFLPPHLGDGTGETHPLLADHLPPVVVVGKQSKEESVLEPNQSSDRNLYKIELCQQTRIKSVKLMTASFLICWSLSKLEIVRFKVRI